MTRYNAICVMWENSATGYTSYDEQYIIPTGIGPRTLYTWYVNGGLVVGPNYYAFSSVKVPRR